MQWPELIVTQILIGFHVERYFLITSIQSTNSYSFFLLLLLCVSLLTITPSNAIFKLLLRNIFLSYFPSTLTLEHLTSHNSPVLHYNNS